MTDNITLPRQTVQQALEALEDWWGSFPDFRSLHDKVTIAALRTALEQQQAEPVAWGMAEKDGLILDVICPEEHQSYEGEYTIPLYTASPQQQAEPVHGDIRALKYRIHELEGEVMGYKRMLDVAEAASQQKPLTDEEIDQLLPEIVSGGSFTVITYGRAVARSIEAAHGIKENT